MLDRPSRIADEEPAGGPVGAGGVEARAQRGQQPLGIDGVRGVDEAQVDGGPRGKKRPKPIGKVAYGPERRVGRDGEDDLAAPGQGCRGSVMAGLGKGAAWRDAPDPLGEPSVVAVLTQMEGGDAARRLPDVGLAGDLVEDARGKPSQEGRTGRSSWIGAEGKGDSWERERDRDGPAPRISLLPVRWTASGGEARSRRAPEGLEGGDADKGRARWTCPTWRLRSWPS
jgi:hypothetical protein